MDRAKVIETQIRNASPLQLAQALKQAELYDQKDAQRVIDEVYEKFATGGAQVDNILKPVTLSIVDGLMEGCKPLRSLRKKGLTASRIVNECEGFSYAKDAAPNYQPDAYAESKNISDEMGYNADRANNHYAKDEEYRGSKPEYRNSDMPEYMEYNRKTFYDDKAKRDDYKAKHFGNRTEVADEYTGELITRSGTEVDHIIPLKEVQHQLQGNVAMNSEDVKQIANLTENYADIDGGVNSSKQDMTNEQFIEKRTGQAKNNGSTKEPTAVQKKLSNKKTQATMIAKSQYAQQKIDDAMNIAVMKTLMGEGNVNNTLSYERRQEFEKNAQAAIEKLENKAKAQNKPVTNKEKEAIYKEEYSKQKKAEGLAVKQELEAAEKAQGKLLSREERKALEAKIIAKRTKKLQEKKREEVLTKVGTAALQQSKDMALGNLIMYILKPIYYELKDSFMHGLKEGVEAQSTGEAIKIRITRVKKHIMAHAGSFFTGNLKEMLKQFASMLVEGLINLFAGALKLFLKAIKEGIKVFMQACKVIFSKDESLTAAQKGDAILKVIGGGVMAFSGIGIEYILNQPFFAPIFATFSFLKPVIASVISGILSALFMNFLDKLDLFAVKAEQRQAALKKIFAARSQELEAATTAMDSGAIAVLYEQKQQFDQLSRSMDAALKKNDMESLSANVQGMARFFRVDLPYANVQEFVVAYDKAESISLS